MVKPIILTAGASTNAISRLDWVEADGAGNVQAVDDTANATAALGMAMLDKDSENNVPVLVQGLANVKAAAATYSFGDKLGCNSSGVAAYSSGAVVGYVAEPEQKVISTTYSSTDTLKVYVNIDLDSLA